MKIGVVGSRDFKNLELIDKKLDEVYEFCKNDKPLPEYDDVMHIITGGARGVDTRAEMWCSINNVACNVIKPIHKSEKISYLFRNVEIVALSDQIIAFWDGKSKGTKFVMDYAIARGKKVLVIRDE